MWWKELMHICDGVGLEVGGWFEENLCREVSNGENAFYFFWTDRRLENFLFHDRFRRLFNFFENKWMTVTNMFILGWGRRGRLGVEVVVSVVGMGGEFGRGV